MEGPRQASPSGLAGRASGRRQDRLIAKADKEAGQLLRVFARASRAIEGNPSEVYQKVSERADVPRQELERFRELLRLP